MLRVEQRAAGVTTAPTNVGTSQAEIVPPVFANGAGALLGNYSTNHTRRRFGLSRFLSTRPDVGEALTATRSDVPETDSARSTPTSWLLSVYRPAPVYRRQDAARFPTMDSALRMALNSGPHGKTRLRGIASGTEGLLTGSEALKSQQNGRNDPRPVSLSILLRPCRWALRRRAKRYQGADGKWSRTRTRAPPIRPRRT